MLIEVCRSPHATGEPPLRDAPKPCSRRQGLDALLADAARPLAAHLAPLLVPSFDHNTSLKARTSSSTVLSMVNRTGILPGVAS